MGGANVMGIGSKGLTSTYEPLWEHLSDDANHLFLNKESSSRSEEGCYQSCRWRPTFFLHYTTENGIDILEGAYVYLARFTLFLCLYLVIVILCLGKV
jgi:hypothetical protein